ncbi:AAA family ATPase [Oceanivirga salmonicida]|uniref:AAA family ATPase n=1 Tax=Oceanivirga salmonicida TaxID=1769291 RepID=UPI000834EACC|nr:AAA family ATPase [Oceanivirga salmonicida]
MFVKELYIKNYKKFFNQNIYFGEYNRNKFEINIFKDMKITAFIGLNGSGKTTILSLIVMIFRYIERYQDRIPTDFILKYSINDSEVIISKVEKVIFIEINKIKYILLGMERKNGRNIYPENEYSKKFNYPRIIFDDIRKYIPKFVIVSGFDEEYMIEYNQNLICDKFVKFYSNLYNLNIFHFQFLQHYHHNENLNNSQNQYQKK